MPIASGANGWPNVYFKKPPPKTPAPKVVVIERNASPLPVKRPPPPPPQVVYVDRPPRPRPQVYAEQYPPEPYPTRGYRPNEPDGCCGGNGSCGPMAMYSTGMAGAGAGCCGGGMFGSKRYPFDPDNEYQMKGNGCKRCCACLCGLLLALLLIGLLLGLLLGLKPALETQTAETNVAAAYPGGYYVNGVYVYPITDPPDVYYLVMGPGIPCNPYNNKTDLVYPTSGYYAGDSVTVENTTATATATVYETYSPPTTLPNCNEITTQYIPVNNITVSTTTTPTPVIVYVTPASAHHVTSCRVLMALLVTVLALC